MKNFNTKKLRLLFNDMKNLPNKSSNMKKFFFGGIEISTTKHSYHSPKFLYGLFSNKKNKDEQLDAPYIYNHDENIIILR